MNIEFTPELRGVKTLRPNTKSEKWYNYDKESPDYLALKKDIQENGLRKYPHIIEDGTIIDGISCVEIYKELEIEDILCYIIKEITEEEIPPLVKSLNTTKERKQWEICEIALDYLPADQQGQDLGGTTKWALAINSSGVHGISEKTLSRYAAVKEYDKLHPEKELLKKIKNPIDPLPISTAHQCVERAKKKEEKIKGNGNKDNALDEDIKVGDPKHFCKENYSVYNQSSVQPWLLNDKKIQLLFFSPPYLNQRNYENGVYKIQSLHKYLYDLYLTMKEGKKHLLKTSIIGISIGNAYNFGANYITIMRLITQMADKLGLFFFYKMTWHKTNVMTKGKEEGHLGCPLYDYEEIIFFCQDEHYQFNPIKYYTKGKKIEVKKTGGRINADGSKTANKWVCSKGYEMFNQFIDQQHFQHIITTASAGVDSKNFTEKYGIQHPAIMPMVIPLYPILCFSKPGQIVADCYAGSGTTLATALLLGRPVFGIEKEERFFNAIDTRLSDICQIINPQDANNIELRYHDKFTAA